MMKLQGGLLQWSRSSLIPSIYTPINKTQFSIAACVIERNHQLTAKERRQLRNERRESKLGYSWREEVEEKLIKKPKKRYATWTEELNLDTLAESGPQWWAVRVSRLRGHETAQILARALARQFPEMEFTVIGILLDIWVVLGDFKVWILTMRLDQTGILIELLTNSKQLLMESEKI